MAKKQSRRPAKLTMMVSSSVYGIEDLLDQLYALLQSLGYTVWMSHKGTVPVNPRKSNFSNCLEAVDKCDVFLGIITGRYGSGVPKGELGITHQEVLRAVSKGKLRWFLVHHDVTVARQLLKQYRFTKDKKPRKNFRFEETQILSDIRVLDMYETAIQQSIPLAQRRGNWVHDYTKNNEALQFVESQFKDPRRIREILKEHRSHSKLKGKT